MSFESRVLQVLHGPTVARIRFRFPITGSHVTITPQTFHHVARAIRSGRVIVRRPTDLDPTAGAQYNDVARTRADGTLVRANTMEIPSLAGRYDEAGIVHESLHAAYDLLRTGLDANSEEASAMVCDALYCRMTGLPRPQWIGSRVFADAERAAQTLLRQYQKGDRGIPMVGAAEWNTLRVGVLLDPAYFLRGAAGLFGTLAGTRYTHDG
jgi:hypothetical protein